ncbi:hypothetical protein D3C81_1939920 [compost metagenome]
MRAEAVLAEAAMVRPVKSRTGAWLAVAAGFALCAGLAGWAVQGNGLQLFAAQPAAKSVAVAAPVSVASVEEAVTPVANLQMSYALTSLPASPAK